MLLITLTIIKNNCQKLKTVFQFLSNKIIMKATQERNPYLKRISSSTPHKYSFDIEKGKYFLHYEDGKEFQINKTGTLKPKFKHSFSGFASAKDRYNEALKQPKFMHYVPDAKYHKHKSFYTPMPDKFAGYSQYPYKLTKDFPYHLDKPFEAGKQPENHPSNMRKSQSQHKKQLNRKKSLQMNNKNLGKSVILQHSANSFMSNQARQKYFNLSFHSMSDSKPLPRKAKRTCYNYKCKHLKQFVFDQKSKYDIQASTKYSSFGNTSFVKTGGFSSSITKQNKTLSRSFYDRELKFQNQENRMLIDQKI